MKQNLYKFLREHCSKELLEDVLKSRLITNLTPSTLGVDEMTVLNTSLEKLKFDVMKVLFVFEKAGGVLSYKGKPICAQDFLTEIYYRSFYCIAQFWESCNSNGDIPFFDKGDIEEVKIENRFDWIKLEEGKYCVRKLVRSTLKEIKGELYKSKEEAIQRVAELNSQIYLPI